MTPQTSLATILGQQKIEPYFIADVGANHDGDLNRAIDLIHLIAEAGGHAAKFQHFSAGTIVSNAGFKDLGSKIAHQAKWKKSVYEIYDDASINLEWTNTLQQECKKVGIEFFTSAYSCELVDFIDPFVDVYKIGSGDITWTEILEHTASKSKPILLATGASDLEDVRRAMNAISKHNSAICLMQCNTNYTGSIDNFKFCNLRVLLQYRDLFPDVALGLSDHTPGHSTVLGALALGAIIFEKHFTDDNAKEGPDHGFAMNPRSWREMVDRSYELWSALGDGHKIVEQNEKDSALVQRRSLHATRNLEKGQIVRREDLFPLRPCPADGIPPFELENIIGLKLRNSVTEGTGVKWTDLDL